MTQTWMPKSVVPTTQVSWILEKILFHLLELCCWEHDMYVCMFFLRLLEMYYSELQFSESDKKQTVIGRCFIKTCLTLLKMLENAFSSCKYCEVWNECLLDKKKLLKCYFGTLKTQIFRPFPKVISRWKIKFFLLEKNYVWN